MKQLLITGFEPFGKDSVNPSWEAVARLQEAIGEYQLTKLLVPTVFGLAAQTVLKRAESLHPDVILCVGQAGGRCSITCEVAALNLRDAGIADNAGNMPQNEPVVPEGENAYFATVPVRRMMEAVRKRDIPCTLSYSAGVYVCNDLLYTLLHHYRCGAAQVGFIHVPYLPCQAGGAAASLPLDVIVQALHAAVEAL